jgi:AAA domain, putative AbiEii toxin, Type IV TA system
VPGETALHDRLTDASTSPTSRTCAGTPTPSAPTYSPNGWISTSIEQHALSKGNRQQLAVVLGLMSAPPVLILDEPTSDLDPFAQEEFLTLLQEHAAVGGSVLLSSYRLAEVQRIADRAASCARAGWSLWSASMTCEANPLHRVRARLTGPATAAEFTSVPGVRHVILDDGMLTCRAPQSALDALIKHLARHHVADLECAEAELEETFLTTTPGRPTMLRSITSRTLYDQRRGLLAWAVSLTLLVAMYVAIWPSVRDQPSVQDFLDRMPKADGCSVRGDRRGHVHAGRLHPGRTALVHGADAAAPLCDHHRRGCACRRGGPAYRRPAAGKPDQPAAPRLREARRDGDSVCGLELLLLGQRSHQLPRLNMAGAHAPETLPGSLR